MSPTVNTASGKVGMPPGSLVHIGHVQESQTYISAIEYNKETYHEYVPTSLDEILAKLSSDTLTWVTIEGLSDTRLIEQIGQHFHIHPLVLEDILNTHQRPKFEEYDDYLYIVAKCLMHEGNEFSINYEQVSLLVLKNIVFTFKERKDTLLAPVHQQIKSSKGRFRALGSDFLTYAILDAIVDQSFFLIDALDDSVTKLEDELYAHANQRTLNKIQRLKREIISIRRSISPMREMLAAMLRSESELISEHTHIYLRDVSDHAIRVLESIESYRDILSGLLDIYLSSISNKMNEVMKVLTIFASIFIPLTFLAGIYGMNFEYMPELHWKWAYPTLWGAFILIPSVLLYYFKKRKWL
jgi:magnesium transporter